MIIFITTKIVFATILCSKAELTSDPSVRKLVTEQTAQWSELAERQRREHWANQRQRLQEQRELLARLMETAQQSQMKQMEAKHER